MPFVGQKAWLLHFGDGDARYVDELARIFLTRNG
jgi:hypothetical protein